MTVTADVRARYYPDKGAADLPQPIHGTVQAAFQNPQDQYLFGAQAVDIALNRQLEDSIHTRVGTGLSAGDQNTLSAEVRKALRDSMTPAPAALPRDFPFADFKGLGSGASQVIALPFQLSGAPAPASGVQPLTQSLHWFEPFCCRNQ